MRCLRCGARLQSINLERKMSCLRCGARLKSINVERKLSCLRCGAPLKFISQFGRQIELCSRGAVSRRKSINLECKMSCLRCRARLQSINLERKMSCLGCEARFKSIEFGTQNELSLMQGTIQIHQANIPVTICQRRRRRLLLPNLVDPHSSCVPTSR